MEIADFALTETLFVCFSAESLVFDLLPPELSDALSDSPAPRLFYDSRTNAHLNPEGYAALNREIADILAR